MGLPQLNISFMKKSETLINRSSRGMVLLIIKDSTKEQFLTPFETIMDVQKTDFTTKNYEYINMIFKAEPYAVVVARAVVKENVVDLTETLKLIAALSFDYLVYPDFTAADKDIMKTFIKEAREKNGKKAKAILPNFIADYEGIINFASDNISTKWDDASEVTVYRTNEYCCRIAGVLAAMPLTKSSTYFILPEIVNIDEFEDPGAEVDAGKLIIIFDGEKYKIARGVTSLTTASENHPDDFKKIKIVEGADIIKHDIYAAFEDDFVGQLNNSYDNKQHFVGYVNKYFQGLEDTVLDKKDQNYVEIDIEQNKEYLKTHGTNIEDMREQELKEANTGSNLFLAGKIKLLDAMEDLNMIMSL